MMIYDELRGEILTALKVFEMSYHDSGYSIPDVRKKNVADIKRIILKHDKGERLANELRYEVKEYVKSLTLRFVRWVPWFSVTYFQGVVLDMLYQPKNCEQQLNIRLRDEYRAKLSKREVRVASVLEQRNASLKKQLNNKNYELELANQEASRLRVENAYLTEQLDELLQQQPASAGKVTVELSAPSERAGRELAQYPTTIFAKSSRMSRQVKQLDSTVLSSVVN